MVFFRYKCLSSFEEIFVKHSRWAPKSTSRWFYFYTLWSTCTNLHSYVFAFNRDRFSRGSWSLTERWRNFQTRAQLIVWAWNACFSLQFALIALLMWHAHASATCFFCKYKECNCQRISKYSREGNHYELRSFCCYFTCALSICERTSNQSSMLHRIFITDFLHCELSEMLQKMRWILIFVLFCACESTIFILNHDLLNTLEM